MSTSCAMVDWQSSQCASMTRARELCAAASASSPLRLRRTHQIDWNALHRRRHHGIVSCGFFFFRFCDLLLRFVAGMGLLVDAKQRGWAAVSSDLPLPITLNFELFLRCHTWPSSSSSSRRTTWRTRFPSIVGSCGCGWEGQSRSSVCASSAFPLTSALSTKARGHMAELFAQHIVL